MKLKSQLKATKVWTNTQVK